MLARTHQHACDELAVARCHIVQEVAAENVPAQGLHGRRVGLDHLQVVGSHHEHRLAGGLEQQPIARLDAAQLPEIALQGLLVLDELGSDLGDGGRSRLIFEPARVANP